MFFGLTKEKANKKLQQAFSTRNFKDVILTYKKLTTKIPNDHELYNNLGIAYMESGLIQESIKAFEKANEILPSCVHLNNLGRALLKQKDFKSSRNAFVKARAEDPGDPRPWYNLTVALREEGFHEDSYAELLKFIGEHPDHINGLNDLGCHCLDRAEFDKAINYFTKAVEDAPEELPAKLNLIRALCDAGRYQDATPYLESLAHHHCLNIKVHGSDDSISIDINNSPFYRKKVDAANN